MAIDYSKWDKIELSDDSDVEVHPNVDKKSFIRWKQQDIHAKRAQRNHDIATLEVQTAMYKELNGRVDKMLAAVTDDELCNSQFISDYLNKNFDKNSKPQGETLPEDSPTYNEMIEDLFTQLKKDLEKAHKNPNDGKELRELAAQHRKKIDDVLLEQLDKLRSLKKERELQISSDDIHTGFDRSFLNKADSKESPVSYVTPTTESNHSSTTATTTTAAEDSASLAAESASTPSTSSGTTGEAAVTKSSTVRESAPGNDNEFNLQIHPDTLKFAQIDDRNTKQVREFLKAHTHIINPQQKDALLMTAFDSQLEGDETRTKQIIAHSLIIQYVYDLIEVKKVSHPQEIKTIIDQLFNKFFDNGNNPGLEAFHSELDRTFNHIKQRCEVLAAENSVSEEAQEIQLKSLDDNAELIVNLPDPNSTDPQEVERFRIFSQIPVNMQEALKTESLDEVNKVFHDTPLKEAEKILELFDECEVIAVQAVMENENEWNHLKSDYENTQKSNDQKLEELDIDDEVINSADIVD